MFIQIRVQNPLLKLIKKRRLPQRTKQLGTAHLRIRCVRTLMRMIPRTMRSKPTLRMQVIHQRPQKHVRRTTVNRMMINLMTKTIIVRRQKIQYRKQTLIPRVPPFTTIQTRLPRTKLHIEILKKP